MDVIGWLMEGDPAVRWQVMRDVIDEPAESVARERSGVATERWGARLLALQAEDGQWGGGFYSPKWVSTTYTLLLLRHLGLDPSGAESVRAASRLRDGGGSWSDGSGFFEYMGETCVTGMNLALGAYFGVTDRAEEVTTWLLDEQLADGGWNCQSVKGSVRSSFHTTISVLEGLLEYERSGRGPHLVGKIGAAREHAHDYLLERRLFHSLSTGDVIDPSWTRFSFPPRWWYDVLRGLDYLRDARVVPDDRWSDALALLEEKRTGDGRWKLQNHHKGREHFRMEQPGEPSRWNTLRALRVQRWVDRSEPAESN